MLATYPLASICISNIKDNLCKANWAIQPKPQSGETRRQAAERGKKDKTAADISRFLEKPDREHTWDDWLRPFLDDMFTIDAACFVMRTTFDGLAKMMAGKPLDLGKDVVELMVMRGESINRYIDINGMTPLAPDPAYAQNWWGIPLVDLNVNQLVYKPRNIVPRNTVSSQLYGMSPTEQLAPILEIGMLRLAFKKACSSDGNIPGAIQIIPAGVAPEKVAEAMNWQSSEGAGNLARRWQIKPLLGFADASRQQKDEVLFPKAPLLSEQYDQDEIHAIAFGYGVSPQRLVKQMNRASAEQADDAAAEEGALPYFTWLKNSVIDYTIQYKFGYKDYEWVPDPFQEPSFEKMAKALNDMMKAGPVMIPNEAREKIGLDPREEPEMNVPGVMTAAGWMPITVSTAQAGASFDGKGNVTITPKPGDQAEGGKPNGKPASAVGKPDTSGKPNGKEPEKRTHGVMNSYTEILTDEPVTIVRGFAAGSVRENKASAHDTRRAVIHPGRSLPQTVVARHHAEKVLINEFKQMRRKVRRRLAKELANTRKFSELYRDTKLSKKAEDDETLKEIERLLRENWKTVANEVQKDLDAAAQAGAANGAAQIELDDAELISKINTQAAKWAEKRAAELVGMRRTEAGRLVQNPDAKWAITDTTREKLREVIAELFTTDNADLKTVEQLIEKAGIFDDQRASMIARTETSRAQVLSNLMAWRESGEVQQVGWQLSAEHDHDDECDENADNSPYAIGEVPEFPAHVNCMCALVLETLVGEEEA